MCTHMCKYCVCVNTRVLPKKPTCMWFTICVIRVWHACHTRGPFKLWVIHTVAMDPRSINYRSRHPGRSLALELISGLYLLYGALHGLASTLQHWQNLFYEANQLDLLDNGPVHGKSMSVTISWISETELPCSEN